MQTTNYVPEICKDQASGWTGSITMRKLCFDEKCDFIDKVQDYTSSLKDLEESARNFKCARYLVSLSKDKYVSCTLNKGDELSASSFEEMQFIDELHGTLIEVAGGILQGFKLGNG